MPLSSLPIQNRLLLALSDEARALLGDLERVSIALRDGLETAGEPIPFVYFPDSCLASVVATNLGGKSIEVGMIGFEGMTGLSLIVGDNRATFDVFAQGVGIAYRIDAGRLRNALVKSDEIQHLFLRYSHAFTVQIASTAFANGHAKLESRLARWLLMTADRMGDTFNVTHEFLSVMLAVRRSGVTLAVQALEGKGLIRATRGTIAIVDRAGLNSMTEGSYGMAEREYERIMGASVMNALLL